MRWPWTAALASGITALAYFAWPGGGEAPPGFLLEVLDPAPPAQPWGKAAGDLDGDGLPDIVVGGFEGQELAWYRSPGWHRGTIAAGPHFSTAVEIADVDGDGAADVIAATREGLAWYQAPGYEERPVDRGDFHDVLARDLNNDGRLDLVARGQSAYGTRGTEVAVFLQVAGGTWQRATHAVEPGEGLAAADLDRDGYTDIIVNRSWLQNRDGGRRFTPHVYAAAWDWPHTKVAAGDIDGDGRAEIALAPAEPAGSRYRIALYTAGAEVTAPWRESIVIADVESVYHSLAIEDIDADGRGDVVTAAMHQGEDPDDVVLAYRRCGGWQTEVVSTQGSHNLVVADFDADGDADIAGANWSGPDQALKLWRNRACDAPPPDGWRRHVIDAQRPGGRALFAVPADIDGDGYADVASGPVVYLNPGCRADRDWRRIAVGGDFNNALLATDIDGDGDTDLLGSHGVGSVADGRLAYAENTGGGRFTVYPGVAAGSGDFAQGIAAWREDGGLRIALSWHATGHGVERLAVPDEPAGRPWPVTELSPASQDEDLTAADLDGDGDTDLVLGTRWLRREAGASYTAFAITGRAEPPDRNAVADIDGDGRPDIVVGYEAISRPGLVAWYRQPADPTGAWPETVIGQITGPMSLDAGDIDGDGDVDIVAGEHDIESPGRASAYWFENPGGGGGWRRHVIYKGDEHHDGMQLADLDNDGDLDAVSIGWSHERVTWYENRLPRCLH